MFTGRQFDIETGLYYYRARYYNPYLGRFLQTDPVGYGDGMNLYAYCKNNPVDYLDPSGLFNIISPQIDLKSFGKKLAEIEEKVSAYYNNPFVYIGFQKENGDRYAIYGQVTSRMDLYGKIFFSAEQPTDKIVYFSIIGHGFDGYLVIGSGKDLEVVTGKLGDNEASRLLTDEHNAFCTWIGINPKNYPFDQLVRDRFAPNATICINACYSAKGGTQSVAHAFKELLPDARVYGWTGKIIAMPISITRDKWIILPWPLWTSSELVEIPLELNNLSVNNRYETIW